MTPEQPSLTSKDRVKRHRRKGIAPARRVALDFADELAKLAQRAPDFMARRDLNRTINAIRLRFAKDPRKAKAAIIGAIQLHEAHTVAEIHEDTGLAPEQIKTTLEQMLDAGEIVKSSRGGASDRARSGTIYCYYLSSVTPPPQ